MVYWHSQKICQNKVRVWQSETIEKVEKLLANTGKFGERKLKSFSRLSFKDDEDFEDYLDELKEEIEEVNQERANEGLEKLGNIPAPDKKPNKKEEELMSDDDVKKLAQM